RRRPANLVDDEMIDRLLARLTRGRQVEPARDVAGTGLRSVIADILTGHGGRRRSRGGRGRGRGRGDRGRGRGGRGGLGRRAGGRGRRRGRRRLNAGDPAQVELAVGETARPHEVRVLERRGAGGRNDVGGEDRPLRPNRAPDVGGATVELGL